MVSIRTFLYASLVCLSSLLLAACGNGVDGGGSIGGGTSGSNDTSVTVSGKVSLLGGGSLSGSSKLSKMASVPKGKEGSKLYMKTRTALDAKLDDAVNYFKAGDVIDNATVFLYDANHPEWLFPVASSFTNSNGDYTLKFLANADKNLDANGDPVYTNGDYIPEGNYTLLAFKPGGFDPILGVTTDPVVAVQTIVNTFTGTVSAADLAAQSSTVKPKVETIIGLKKNTDGTQTWGNSSIQLPANSAIPVTFSMAMSRASVLNGVSINPSVEGEWSVSADWLSAIFYPDSGTGLTSGQVYTITVNGADTSASGSVTNVYGNPLAKTATATFTAIAADNTAPVVSITSPASGPGVSIVDPVRITSNEPLDINTLTLTSTPSLGDKPGVLFVGKLSGQYIYDFILADPLAPGTSYNITVSGGTDLSGNVMTTDSRSFTTQDASSVNGIDVTADATTQAVQADVLDVFGRWVRAFNDRSVTQLQAMMTGDFVFEYDVSQHGPDEEDLNRDGRLDLEEFTSMFVSDFNWFDYCQTTMTGNVVGNVNVVANKADFEFSLIFSSTNTSQECTESPEKLFATVSNINGSWLVGRVSEGIDTRNRTLDTHSVMSGLKIAQNSTTLGSEAAENLNGAPLSVMPVFNFGTGAVTYPAEFSWDAVDGATAYVFYIVNARDDDRGRAYILPATSTSWTMPRSRTAGGGDPKTWPEILPANVVAVKKLFGFDVESGGSGFTPDLGMLRDGGEFYWTVMALDSNVPTDFDVDGNKSYDPNNTSDTSRATNLFQQITAVSRQYRFKNPGIFKEITFDITDAGTMDLTFNEQFNGYNANENSDPGNQINLVITTPNLDNGNGNANLYVNGHSQRSYPINFDPSGVANVTVDLFEGMNWVDVYDGVDLFKGFNVKTSGGASPVLTITSVMDQSSNVLTPDPFGYIDTGTSNVTSVILNLALNDPNVRDVDTGTPDADINASFNVNIMNDSGASDSQTIPVQVALDGTSGTANFTVQVPVYAGHNWINIDSNYCTNPQPAGPSPLCSTANNNFGVHTTTGTPWVPQIHTIAVTTAVLTDDYGQSQNWDASNDPDDKVTVTGVLENPTGGNTPQYSISSDGAWLNENLTVNANGSFSIPVDLYNGWNHLDITDAADNWYHVAIFTTQGRTVVRPQINTINSVAYSGNGFASTNQCTATITGQALANTEVQINWNGDDGVGNYNNENIRTLVGPDGVDGDGLGSFSAIVPLMSGGYNNIDVFDENWRGVFVQVTTTASCSYSAPVLTLDAVTNATNTGGNNFDAGANASITLQGTSTMAGRQIVVTNWICTGEEQVSTSAATTGGSPYNWSVTVPMYEGFNNVEITDGVTFSTINVDSTNGNVPVEVLSASVTGATDNTPANSCGFASFDAGTATSVTITGTTTAPDGTAQFNDADGMMSSFDIVSGAFSFTTNVYNGGNFISIDDTDFNHFNVEVFTTNGIQRTRYIEITSHTHDQVVTGPTSITVTGSIDPSFTPTRVKAFVYDEDTSASPQQTMYSSDTYEQTTMGAQPLTVSGNTFSFNVNVTSDQPVSIDVNGRDDATFVEHGHSIYINNINNYGEWSYKPGSSGSGGGGKVKTDSAEVKRIKQTAAKQHAEDSYQRLHHTD